jgi:hypothetical protein
MGGSPTAASAQRAPADDEPTLATLASGTAALVRELATDTLGLAALEVRLAAISLAGMVAAALAAAFAVMAFWLLLQAGLMVAFARMGADVLWLLVAFTVFNGLTALLLLLSIRRLSRHLTFKATAEALRGRSTHETPETRNPA